MSFFKAYFTFLGKVHQRTNKGRPADLALSNLLQTVTFTDRPLQLHDIHGLLNDLRWLKQWELAHGLDDSDDQDINQLIDLMAARITELSGPMHINEHTLKKWTLAYPKLATRLMSALGFELWLKQHLRREGYRYTAANVPQDPRVNDHLLTVVLERLVDLDVLPSKGWYFSIDELAVLPTRTEVLELAYSEHDSLQNLDRKYPGFLLHFIRNLDDLTTFCQLLPMAYQSLIKECRLIQLQIRPVDLAYLFEHMNEVEFEDRFDMVAAAIQSNVDLIEVIRTFPGYVWLLFSLNPNQRGGFLPGRCASWIKSVDDFYQMNLSNEFLQRVIHGIPQFQQLVGCNPGYIVDTAAEVANPPAYRRLQSDCRLFAKQAGALRRDPRLMTLGEAITATQFQEDAGYYSSGTIVFKTDTNEGHFQTDASKGYVLAMSLAFRALEVWQQAPAGHKACFEVLECGGGEGDLCFKILDFSRLMAAGSKQWAQFYAAIHYTIIELAPALVRRQRHKLAEFIEQGKAEVMQGNALNVNGYNKSISFHISNELPDMFPSQKITLNSLGACCVEMVVPILTPRAFTYLNRFYPDSVADLPAVSKKFSALLDFYDIDQAYIGFALTADQFKRLLPITTKTDFQGPKDCFLFSPAQMALDYFPDIQQFLLEHEEVLVGMNPGDSKIICPLLPAYARLIAKSLVSIVVDYGDVTTNSKNRPYRSYGHGSTVFKHLIWRRPGRVDITYDIDYSVLVNSLQKLAPKGYIRVEGCGQLFPTNLTMPTKYIRLCSPQEMYQFAQANNVLCMVYIAEGTNIRLQGFETNEARSVTQLQLFNKVTARATAIVRNNFIELENQQKSAIGPK